MNDSLAFVRFLRSSEIQPGGTAQFESQHPSLVQQIDWALEAYKNNQLELSAARQLVTYAIMQMVGLADPDNAL